jgi:hypothetical protein
MADFDLVSELLQKAWQPFVQAQVDDMKRDLADAAARAEQISQTGLVILGVALVVAVWGALWVTASVRRAVSARHAPSF